MRLIFAHGDRRKSGDKKNVGLKGKEKERADAWSSPHAGGAADRRGQIDFLGIAVR